jgi:hypothetical protein
MKGGKKKLLLSPSKEIGASDNTCGAKPEKLLLLFFIGMGGVKNRMSTGVPSAMECHLVFLCPENSSCHKNL